MNRIRELLLLASLGVAGCATWSESALPELPLPRMSQDSVVLETAFVRIPVDLDLEGVWREVDEQQLDPTTRGRLAANGIRLGVVGTQLPDSLRRMLDSPAAELPRGQDPLTTSRPSSLQQQVQNRAGERSELIVVPQIAPGTAVLVNDEGKVRAQQFQEGQALLALRTYPAGDGTVRLEVSPVVKHGQVRQQWAPGNGVYRYDFSREEFVFEQLRFEVLLSPGQSLVVASTAESKGLGGLLFARPEEPLVLLIRLAQTQYNDLFAPEQDRQPFVTPVE